MTSRLRRVALAALILAGCRSPADEAPAPAPPAVDPVAGARAHDEAGTLVGTISAGGVPADLDGGRYRETWDVLPGTSPLHPGVEPHGALLTTYANRVAMEAIERGARSMPAGAAILVEDYLADSTLLSISAMVRDGSGLDGDWHFARFGSAGEVEVGSEEMCRSCHVLDPDFVFGWELGTPLPIDSTGASPSGNPAPGPGEAL